MGNTLTDDDAALGHSPVVAPQQAHPRAAARSPRPPTVVRLADAQAISQSRRRREQPATSSAAPITVLSIDPSLCDLIRASAPALHRVFRATSVEEAEEFAATDRCAILVTDYTIAHRKLVDITSYLRAYEPALVTIAVGSPDEDSSLVDLLAEGVIDRFIVRPLKPEPTRLVIESAARQHHGLKGSASPARPANATRVEHSETAAKQEAARINRAAPQAHGVKKLPPERHERSGGTRSEQVGRVAPQAPAAAQDLTLIRKAPTRPRTAPRLEQAAGPAPLAGELTRIDWRERSTVERQSATEAPGPQPVAATRFRLGRFKRSGWLALAAALAACAAVVTGWLIFESRRPVVQPSVIAATLAAAERAYAEGRFIEPPAANALESYRAVLAVDPQNAAAGRGIERIADRLIDDARALIAEERLAQAVEALQDVRGVRPDHPELAALDAGLREALQQRLLEQARAAVVDPSSPSKPADRVIARYVAPEYPAEALSRGVEGWIDVRLQVNAAGDVVSASVERGERRDIFESAAIAAARQWQYEPRTGAALDVVTTRVGFRVRN